MRAFRAVALCVSFLVVAGAGSSARAQAAPDFSGVYTSDRVTLELTAGADGVTYQGRITVAGTAYPCRGRYSGDAGFAGAFDTPDQSYPFTLRPAVDGTFLLTSGGATHTLSRQAAAATPAGNAAGNGLPPVLRPGLQVTWRGGNATRAGSSLVPDPQGLISVRGVRHRLQASRGGGGIGYIQLTIQHAEPAIVAGEIRNFLLTDIERNVSQISGIGGIVGNGDALGDLWINPARLAALADGRDIDGQTTYRRDYTAAGRLFKAITIYRFGDTTYTSHTYDEATGILLFKAAATLSPNSIIQDGQNSYRVQGNVDTEHAEFVGARPVTFAGGAAAVPAWAVEGRRLDYRGDLRFVAPQMEGLPQLPPTPGRPQSVSYVIGGGAADFRSARGTALNQLDANLPPQETVTERIFGSQMYHGLWASPQALRQMSPNQLLDQDPITGFRTIFGGIQNGAAVVVEEGPTDTAECFYDMESGMMVCYRFTRRMANNAQSILTYRLTGR